jgi:succinate dehydrogenase/fumarate reductase flavoprotein subunit
LKNSKNLDILAANGYSPTSITRDELAQVIMKEILAGPEQRGSVYMDLTELSHDSAQAVSTLLPAGWFKGDKVFEVAPTTHFCMGGIVTDTNGRTSCPGLFAAGEAAAGSHGANRLAGNALAEIIAMGGITGRSAADSSISMSIASEIDDLAEIERQHLTASITQSGPQHREVIQKLKEIMWFNAGILRDQHSLETALKAVMDWKDIRVSVTTPRDLIRFLEFKNLCLVSETVCRSALERTETRGAHFRLDYPEENDRAWLKNIRASQAETGILIEHVPVPKN